MKSNIQALFSDSTNESTGVASVTDAKHGHAIMVDINGTEFPVAGHLSQVELLKTGDQVLTMRTATGIIIAGRLRTGDEAPAPRLQEQDGRLLIEATKSIRLQSGQHRIEVHADGRIELDGQQITGLATGRLRLQGSTIELN